MNCKLFFCLIILFVSSTINSFAQTKTEIESLKTLFQTDVHTQHWSSELKNNTNEVQFVLSAMFVFYKTCISSQDAATCTFTPSCSVYGVQSIKRKGLIIGILATFDRLTRCNPYSRADYEIDEQSKKLKDEVE